MEIAEWFFNNLSQKERDRLRRFSRGPEELAKDIAQDIHKLASICCGYCRLKDHEIECNECAVHDIKKKYEGVKTQQVEVQK